MRLLLFSDLHLETPFAWAPPAVGRARRRALVEVLHRVVALADELDVDALLCGGDLYEHELAGEPTGRLLAEAFAGLGRPVLLAPGNHDWFGPSSLYARTRWPSTVHVFSELRLRPHVLVEGLTVWGAAHLAPAGTPGFLDGFRVDRGGVNLGLFHATLEGPVPSASPLPHAPFRVPQIAASGLHHALLGHIHTPADGELHTYPGNPEPLTFGERGERGAVLVEVAPDGGVRRRRHGVAVTEVYDVELDVTGAVSGSDVLTSAEALLAPLMGCVRVTLVGELDPGGGVSPEALLTDVPLVGRHLEAVVVRAGALSPGFDVEALASEPTVRGAFVRDVLGSDLEPLLRRRVLVTGLRALDGRASDLEVL